MSSSFDTQSSAEPASPFGDAELIDQVEGELRELAAQIGAWRARMLALIAQVDASGLWISVGAGSCVQWLATLLDIEPSTAREHLRVARALRNLPQIREALEAGDLSYAKVRHLTRVATRDTEQELLVLARDHAAAGLPAALARWQDRNEPDRLRDRQRADRSLTTRTDVTGNRITRLVLAPEESAVFEALLDAELQAVADARPNRHDHPDRPSLAQQRADAFCRLIDRVLRTASMGNEASDDDERGTTRSPLRPEVILHRRVGTETFLDGRPLPKVAARLLGCDADVRLMSHWPDGSPADVGRRHRVVTPRLRRLLEERAGGRCEHPGCSTRQFLHAHHVVHWEDGGPTDLANLRLLCALHHRLAHTDDPGCRGARAA